MHLHWDSAISVEWIVQNASYRDDCFVFLADTPPAPSPPIPRPIVNGSLHFFPPHPDAAFTAAPPPTGFVSLAALRVKRGAAAVDTMLMDMLTTTPTSFHPGASAGNIRTQTHARTRTRASLARTQAALQLLPTDCGFRPCCPFRKDLDRPLPMPH